MHFDTNPLFSMQKKYYERKQLKHRKKHGKVEKRSELIERLKKKKEEKEKIRKAKEEIENKTGKEYFFKYNSVKKDGLIEIIRDTKDDLVKKNIFVDKEIDRVEKKLKGYINKIKPNKIVFDEDGTPIKQECESFASRDSEEMTEYKEYLNQLFETKKKIIKQLDELK